MADYRISVDTSIDTRKLDNFEKRINALNGKPISLDVKLSIDGKDVASQINSQVGKALNVSSNSKKIKIRPDVDVDMGAFSKKANGVFNNIQNKVKVNMDIGNTQEYLSNIKEIQKQIQYINRLSIKPEANLAQLKEADKYLDKLVDRKNKADLNEIFDLSDLDTESARQFALELEQVEYAIADIKAKAGDLGFADAMKKQEAELKASMSRLKSQMNELHSLQAKQVNMEVGTEQYDAAERRISELKNSTKELRAELSTKLPESAFSSLDESVRKSAASIDLLKAKLKDVDNANVKSFLKKYDSDKIFADLDNLSYRFDKLDKPSKTLANMKDGLDGMRASLGGVIDDFLRTGDTNNLLSWVDDFNSSFEQFSNNMRIAETTQKRLRDSVRDTNKNAKLQNDKDIFSWQIKKWSTDNSAAMNMFGDRIDTIISKIKTADSVQLTGLKSQFKQIQLEAAVAGKDMKNFGDRLKDQVREYGAYALVAGGLAASVQTLRVMAQNVLEVDTAMVGLYRVTDLTSNQYDKLYDNMISSSKEYGRTLTDTINATSDWVRAGFDADTAVGLAGITSMYQNVSDLDYDEATKNLLTAYKGFQETFNGQFAGDSLKSVEHIADVYNKLDNEFAVTAAGLGEGLARSASALEVAGNTFEESAAMVGAISEVTQDPKYIGA